MPFSSQPDDIVERVVSSGYAPDGRTPIRTVESYDRNNRTLVRDQQIGIRGFRVGPFGTTTWKTTNREILHGYSQGDFRNPTEVSSLSSESSGSSDESGASGGVYTTFHGELYEEEVVVDDEIYNGRDLVKEYKRDIDV